MTATATPVVPLDELICLFTGVPDGHGGWATTPSYLLPLAYEICRRTGPASAAGLRIVIYDSTDPDTLPTDALEAIKLGFERYRLTRQMQGARGL